MAAAGASAALAGQVGPRQRTPGPGSPGSGADERASAVVGPADVAPAAADAAALEHAGAMEAGALWGYSSSGRGIGARGNGHVGLTGEGTHTGVSGDGFIGVRGVTSSSVGRQDGVGVWAESQVPGHLALRTDGPSQFNGQVEFNSAARFSRSGAVTVRPGMSRVTKKGLALSDDTVILATLQSHVPGVYVHAVEVDAAGEAFTIFLTKPPPRDVRIGWFAVG
jgi:hypothetical protein